MVLNTLLNMQESLGNLVGSSYMNKYRCIKIGDVVLADNSADFSNYAMPVTRRVFSELLSTNVTWVQPLSQPMGLSYAMRFAYETDKEYRKIKIGDSDELTTEFDDIFKRIK